MRRRGHAADDARQPMHRTKAAIGQRKAAAQAGPGHAVAGPASSACISRISARSPGDHRAHQRIGGGVALTET